MRKAIEESGWKLLRKRLPECQEAHMEKLLKGYAELYRHAAGIRREGMVLPNGETALPGRNCANRNPGEWFGTSHQHVLDHSPEDAEDAATERSILS